MDVVKHNEVWERIDASTHSTKKEKEMDKDTLEGHEATAFEEFWLWRRENGISSCEADWIPWWECFWAGYETGVK